jgi:hypothetical protein
VAQVGHAEGAQTEHERTSVQISLGGQKRAERQWVLKKQPSVLEAAVGTTLRRHEDTATDSGMPPTVPPFSLAQP